MLILHSFWPDLHPWCPPGWIIALGIIGDRPAKIVDALDAQSQISFKVFAIWE